MTLRFAFPALLVLPLSASASAMALLSGSYVIPSGTTYAWRPELGGSILYDGTISINRLTPVYFRRISAKLQTRVVKSWIDGTLAFYYRWIPQSGNEVSLTQLSASGFRGFLTDVDFRLDGLGTYGTILARRDSDGINVRFWMPNQPTYVESRFHFIRTNAQAFGTNPAVAPIMLSLYSTGPSESFVLTLNSTTPFPIG